MTTVNKTTDGTKEVLTLISTEAATKAWMWLGDYYSRVSSGADRSPNTYPTFTKVPISYVKPRKTKSGYVGGDTRVRYKWVYKRPERAVFEEEHAYTATHTTHSTRAGLAVKRLGVWYYLGTPKNWDLTTVTDPWSSNDDISLLGKLREEIAGSSFNAGVAAAESKRSLEMITQNATKIFEALRAVKRGNPRLAFNTLLGKNELTRAKWERNKSRFVSTPHAAAQNWLELQYGWKPLLSDIYEGSVFLDHLMNRPTVYRVVVTRNAGGKKVHQKQLVLPSTYATMPIDVKSSSRIVAKLTAINSQRLSGLMDPLSIAWEMVPFSFVADWFIPIGNFLSAQELARSITGIFVTTHILRWRCIGSKATTLWQLSSLNDGRGIYMTRTKFTRTVSTTLQIPMPDVQPLSKVASWQHATNAVALLVGGANRRSGFGV